MDEATKQAIRESALKRLGLPDADRVPDAIEVAANYLPPKEMEPTSIGHVLAERARKVLAEKAERRAPVGILNANVDSTDDANCDDIDGMVRTAADGERCYRLFLLVAIEAPASS